MIFDAVIIIFILSAVFRGREIGLVQQLFSTIGFFGGLLLGAVLQPHVITQVSGQANRSILTIAITLGMAFLLLVIGEIVGATLKHKLQMGKFDSIDNLFGSVISVVSVLIAVWLGASVIKTLPVMGLQEELNNSRIVVALTDTLPYAPDVIAGLGSLISPNGFPQVFINGERSRPAQINLPAASELNAAVAKTRESVVKIVGQGCGGIVDGSGFVVGNDMVVTNAHVVAGITRQFVTDNAGNHSATVIWFDSKLDIAVLRVPNLSGDPLALNTDIASDGSAAAVLGYPGGGAFTANPASIIEQFTATGRDIYGRGNSQRQVYEIASDVEPGNSGGPLVNAAGEVIGVIFARSTSYEDIGYALTADQAADAVSKASARGSAVSTGSCAE